MKCPPPSPPPPPQNPLSFSFKAISSLQSVIHSAQNGNTENVSSPTWRHSALLCIFTGVLAGTPRAVRLARRPSSLVLILKEALTTLPAPSHPLGSNYGNNTASQERQTGDGEVEYTCRKLWIKMLLFSC